jgi:hypothetical protein
MLSLPLNKLQSNSYLLLIAYIISAIAAMNTSLLSFEEGKFGKVSVGANSSANYDSNIFSSNLNEGDFILKTTPTVTYSKKVGVIVLTASAGLAISKYASNTNQDAVDPQTNFDVDLSGLSDRIGFMKSGGGKLKFDAYVDLGQNTSTNVIEQDIVTSVNYIAGLDIRYDYSKKFGLGSKLEYSLTQSTGNATYSDIASWSLSGRAFYIYSEKLEFFGDYEYKPVSGSGGVTTFIDAATHEFKFGASGDLFKKIKGDVYVGYSFKNFESSDVSDDSAITFGGGLTWEMNSKRSMRFNMSRSFSASPQNQSLLTTNFSLALNHKFDNKTNGTVSARYSTTDYTGSTSRSTDILGFGARITRTLNKNMNMGFSYDYSQTKNESSADFDRHLTTLDFNVNY